MKPGESFQQSLARFDAALRKLQEQQVELPSVAKGYMLMKKLRLESREETMILTATKGDMTLKEVSASVRSIFQMERCSTDENQRSLSSKGVLSEPEDEVQEVMEVIAEEHQNSDGDDENALEI